jgi:hypothetical protein
MVGMLQPGLFKDPGFDAQARLQVDVHSNHQPGCAVASTHTTLCMRDSWHAWQGQRLDPYPATLPLVVFAASVSVWSGHQAAGLL